MGVRNSSQGTGDRQILLWAAAQASQKWVSEFWIYSGYCFAPQSQSFQQVVSSNCLWAHGHCSVIVFSDPQETDSNGSGTMSVEDFCGLSTETISLADVVNPIISNDEYEWITHLWVLHSFTTYLWQFFRDGFRMATFLVSTFSMFNTRSAMGARTCCCWLGTLGFLVQGRCPAESCKLHNTRPPCSIYCPHIY